jgi:hypothetical protein
LAKESAQRGADACLLGDCRLVPALTVCRCLADASRVGTLRSSMTGLKPRPALWPRQHWLV